MKILIADKFEAVGVERLKGVSPHVFAEAGLKGDALVARIRELDPEILIVRSTKAPREAIEGGKRLRLIIRAGSGVDNIDVAAASQRGIMVSNCPGQNAVAVAELTLGLIIALDRRIAECVNDTRAHKWNKSAYAKTALGLKGRTLGVVGAGKIGGEVVRRALAFEMNVLYYHLGRNRRLADFPQARRAELDDLLRESDVVTIHVPGGESTKNLIDARRIGLLKKSALLINTARADVLDEEALIAALRENRLRGAGLDVFRGEPPADATEVNAPICDVPNLYATHHLGASTEQAQLAVADETCRIVEVFAATGRAENCVNMRQPAKTPMLIVRLVNKPGGLAHIFAKLADENINVEEMDHVIYDGGNAACAHIRISGHPSDAGISALTQHPNVLAAELVEAD